MVDASPSAPPIDHVIYLIHGIRDFGEWQSSIERALDGNGRKVVSVKFGRFPALYFLSPIPIHFRKLWRVQKELVAGPSQYTGARFSVIAHSFGTYLLTQIVKKNFALKFDRIIFCGGVVNADFNWDRVQHCVTSPPMATHILNECGDADPWPVMAETFSWRYGRTGTRGFGTIFITDRFHPGSHSSFLNEEFARKYWLPFLENGTIVPTTTVAGEKLPQSWRAICAPPFIYVSRALCAAVYFRVYWLLISILLFGWGFLSPFLFKASVDSADLMGALAPTGQPASWRTNMNLHIWSLTKAEVHVHGIIQKVDGNTVTLALIPVVPGQALQGPTTAHVRLAKDSDMSLVGSHLGRELCVRGHLESTDNGTLVLRDMSPPVVYVDADSFQTISDQQSGVIVTTTGQLSSHETIDSDGVRCKLKVGKGNSIGTVVVLLSDGKELNGIHDGDFITVQGRRVDSVNGPIINDARRVVVPGTKPYHAAEFH